MPVLPLNDVVLFPGLVAPLLVNTQRSSRLAEAVAAGDRMFIALLQREPGIPDDQVTPAQLYEVGCVARLIRMLKFPDETLRILVQGEVRCRIRGFEEGDYPFLRAAYELMSDRDDKGLEVAALARNASQQFQEVITLSPTLPEELKIALFNIEDPGRLSDLIAANLNMPLPERQALLATTSVKERLERITVLINREREVLRLGREIQSRVSETFSKTQKEIFLREQLKQIQSELGETDISASDLRKRLAEAELPDEVRTTADRELSRLAVTPPASPEYGMIRTYLEWIADLPWSRLTEDRLDLRAARRELSSRHHGLLRVQDRILEFLAVLKLKKALRGPILCFVGPPGVGKTSLGQAIAAAMDRRFVRLSLGGIRDEAEIRGHRRTYVGALPGRILQGLRRAGARNPVFMLDEVDKIGADFRGDPAAALLEVLDPEQNHSFVDHYLDLPFDLSRVLFIATANVLDPIPPALRDRMETIELPGYSDQDKRIIARRHLLPKLLEAHGVEAGQLQLTEGALAEIIQAYTREAGVRNLERELAGICRKAAREIAAGRRGPIGVVEGPRLRRWLGPPRYVRDEGGHDLPAGVARGLAWTPAGGEILSIEAALMPGRGRLTLTGLLGDVMKESAQTAVSLVRSRAERWGLPLDLAEQRDVHLHVPAGAISKDGPSAGLAMAAALVSAACGQPLDAAWAMSGEITLSGRVLPVGGIREKVMAAARAGVRNLLLPARNRPDFAALPREVRRSVAVRWVSDVDSAMAMLVRRSGK